MGELLHGSPIHRPINSSEIVEWAAELKIRADEEREALAPDDDVDTLSGDGPTLDNDAIVAEARRRGHIS